MDIKSFVSTLSELNSSSTFLSIMGYKNEAGEVSNYSIIFNMSYKNALVRSIETLTNYIPETDIHALAKKELLKSFKASLVKINESGEDENLDDGYIRFFNTSFEHIKGVKLHANSNTLHLYGLVVHKKVLVKGNYPVTNRRDLTIAKDELRRLTPLGKFRQFKLTADKVDYITVNNISMLPPE